MSGGVEVFLDDTPGETRGIVARGGRYERLIIHREDATPQYRLGARCVGRVIAVEPAFGAAFVDLGAGEPFGFLPGKAVKQGDRIEVEVTAEPRGGKGPALKRLGAGEGAPRLLAAGPDVAARLAMIAPGAEVQTGRDAIAASLEAEQEALSTTAVFPQWALDLAVERTRALVAVDIDFAAVAGRDAGKGRAAANREGMAQAARLIRLKGWGGLVAIDLVGAGLNGEVILKEARAAFTDPGAAFGPLSRFGVLQLSLPWTQTPVEEVLGADSAMTRAIEAVRRLRQAILSDTATPRVTLACAHADLERIAPLAARLGPRAAVTADPALAVGRFRIDMG
ncbi:MAG: RNA-binding protein [Brevundimonas sp.]|nr:MAG: RNA-binding protein [Brevundimonas sp.]